LGTLIKLTHLQQAHIDSSSPKYVSNNKKPTIGINIKSQPLICLQALHNDQYHEQSTGITLLIWHKEWHPNYKK